MCTFAPADGQTSPAAHINMQQQQQQHRYTVRPSGYLQGYCPSHHYDLLDAERYAERMANITNCPWVVMSNNLLIETVW